MAEAKNKKEFIKSEEVQAFIKWLSCEFIAQHFTLDIKPSRFVPNGIKSSGSGLEFVLDNYKWKSGYKKLDGKLVTSLFWKDTKILLSNLSKDLKNSIKKEDSNIAYDTCLNILAWGGDRSSRVGATPQIKKLKEESKLCEYLKNSQKFFDGEEFNQDACKAIEYTGSMWTKIYSLASVTSVPIYDSRVALAITSILLKYKIENNISFDKRDELNFFIPSGESLKRSSELFKRYPQLFKRYQHNKRIINWAVSTLKLSWIIESVLSKTKIFVHEGSLESRKHAFEASLFILGYSPAESLEINI